ncbi:DNA-directed RNA polymerase subunit epsilon [Halorubellus sp. JP-L1]|uniref:DNA-directed RNA polymerase subunit epsilon n=1 Tax=Halorubellus sp. JP-L1 TaxID=2715753 RepID=UPI00140AFBF0|nr:DNA-directed RNA polymerase subunit epsilon [Halorubellus sp. JP-L1]NHN43120.1 DNA-directed RNA polymerase subunit epsilon [Halorubellus sp. JP-L1]
MTEGHPPRDVDPAFDDVERRDVSSRPGDGSLSRVDAVKDERFRRWDVATPAATIIGRPESPDGDVSENLRRLHDEQHPAMAGHSARMHRLEKARITHAYASALDVTPWERDRAMGIMVDLDLTVFGQQRAIEKVSLVVLKYVVDDERERKLGLQDESFVASLTGDEMESLYDRYESLSDEDRFQELMEAQDLDVTKVNRLERSLREQVVEQDLEDAVLGRSPYRDPAMPSIRETPGESTRTVDDSG